MMMVFREHDMLQHTVSLTFSYFLSIASFSEKIEIVKVGAPLGIRAFWTFSTCYLIIINRADPSNSDDSSILFSYIIISLIILLLFLIIEVILLM